jgi:hypothetical protein
MLQPLRHSSPGPNGEVAEIDRQRSVGSLTSVENAKNFPNASY